MNRVGWEPPGRRDELPESSAVRRDERLDEPQPVEPRREPLAPAARRRGFPLSEEEPVASADDGGGRRRLGAVAREELGAGGHGDGGRGRHRGCYSPHHRRSTFPSSSSGGWLAGGEGREA